MNRKNEKRKKFFVSKAIQGRMLLRLSGYFILYTLFIWHVFFITEGVMRELPKQSVLDQYFGFYREHGFLLACSLSIFPILFRDMIKFSNRISGPFVRFERALKSMTRGERIDPVTLRDGDLVDEFLEVFNEFIIARNRELNQRLEPCDSFTAEPAAVEAEATAELATVAT